MGHPPLPHHGRAGGTKATMGRGPLAVITTIEIFSLIVMHSDK